MILFEFEIKGHKFHLDKVNDAFITYKSEFIDDVSYEIYISLFKPKKRFSIGYVNVKQIICKNRFNINSKVKSIEYLELKTTDEIIKFMEGIID